MKEKKNKISYIKLFARMALIILSFVTSAAFVVALSLLLVCGCGLFIIFSGILMITLFGIVALAVDFDYGCYLFSTLPQVFQMFIACGGLFGLSIILIALAGKIFELILPSPKEAKYEAYDKAREALEELRKVGQNE